MQSHSEGYFGHGASEEMYAVWGEWWRDRIAYRPWPHDLFAFYHIWYVEFPWWGFHTRLFFALQSVCGFKSINIQDDWGDDGAPAAYTKFFEDLFPDVPWFEV